MASFSTSTQTVFPEGTSVSVYTEAQVQKQAPPQGTAVATASVTSGVLTFTGLTAGQFYVAYAQVSGVDKYLRFRANDAPFGVTPPYNGLSGGTNSTPTDGSVYVTNLIVPTHRRLHERTLTGVTYRIGTVGGTDKAIAALFDENGKVLATSALAGVTVGTAATAQSLPFTSQVKAKPGEYFVGLQFNGNTARFQTVPASPAGPVLSTEVTGGTFGTIVDITPPSTFTADKAPVISVY